MFNYNQVIKTIQVIVNKGVKSGFYLVS